MWRWVWFGWSRHEPPGIFAGENKSLEDLEVRSETQWHPPTRWTGWPQRTAEGIIAHLHTHESFIFQHCPPHSIIHTHLSRSQTHTHLHNPKLSKFSISSRLAFKRIKNTHGEKLWIWHKRRRLKLIQTVVGIHGSIGLTSCKAARAVRMHTL